MIDWDLRRKQLASGVKALRCWFVPFCRSHLQNGDLRPFLAFLFTDLACNYHCYYCYGSHMPGERRMNLETAKRSVDWLHSLGCRVLAFMGGEPLLRKQLILDVARYASDRGFYVYLPTNGMFMDEHFIEDADAAGIDLINLALDCVDEKPGLPKALNRIRPQYELLREKCAQGTFVVVFNININPQNVDDVRELTEIAHRDGINVDYHIVEPPLHEQSHFATSEDSVGFLPEHYEKVDELLDWLLEKYRQGYRIANSPQHFVDAKKFIRGEPIEWDCRAGVNTVVIMPSGRLAPCFEMFNDGHDWGCVGQPRFEGGHLADMKQRCVPRCMSTCNYTTAYYNNLATVFGWIGKYFNIRR